MDGCSGDSVEKLQRLQISSFDDDDDVEEEDDYTEDEDEEEQPLVTLGFLDKPKYRWSLLRQSFPSKTGGVPAWLDPVNLPSGRSCVCDMCGEPLQFVLQVYAPIFDKESTFHRTLFVFMCTSMSCLLRDQHEQWKRRPERPLRSVKVFRCQLPRINDFYSSDNPNRDGTDEPSHPGVALCNWCGTWKGDKVCSGCKKERYCSQKHQVMHWRSGHRAGCQQLNLSSQLLNSSFSGGGTTSVEISKVASKALWPEYEIAIEDESECDTNTSDYNGYAKSLVSRSGTDGVTKSLLDEYEGDSDKKCWASFQERIARAPEQVLRYSRNAGAKPLWPLSSGQPSEADIPRCCHCGGPMNFEFQIMSQLLYYFGVSNDVNSLDWATIIVYTCEASCDASVSYKEEFPWVQLFSQSAT